MVQNMDDELVSHRLNVLTIVIVNNYVIAIQLREINTCTGTI